MLTTEEKALLFFELNKARVDLASEDWVSDDMKEWWDGVISSIAEKLDIDLNQDPVEIYEAMVSEQEGK